ncbi:MAG: hypothetical protein QOF18_2651 [Frankiaceae bacterium]|nr:hypothetical protein [Frankiaceae bacterium]
MTDGLVVLIAWVEFAILLIALLAFLLHPTSKDPAAERERDLSDPSTDDQPPGFSGSLG